MASSSSSSGEDDFCVSARTPSHKKGPVYMAKLIKQHTKAGTKLTVNFDSKGNPKGQNGTNWRSFLGMVARSRIPITFNDWRKVPDHYKLTLWRDATVIFDGCEPHKKHEMKVAGSIWKNFKSRLAKEYIHGAKANEDPIGEYKYLDKDTWRIFKEQRLSENAMKLRETNKELVKKNVYAHILGRGGYRQLEEKLTTEKIAELFAQGAIEEVQSSVTIERHELWKRGRKNKNDEYVTEASKRVATKIDELVESSSQGQFVSRNRRHDILTEAIGTPEPKGRTRGVGSHIPWRVGLPISTSSGGMPSSSNPIIRIDASDHGSLHCPIDSDPLNNIPEGGLKSLLYIEGQLEGDKHLVAIGRSINGRFVNFRAIPQDTVKVKVDKVLYRGRGAVLPTAHPRFSTVQEAVNHHVAWPKDLVVVDKRAYDIHFYESLPLTGDDFVDEMTVDCRLLREVWKTLGRASVTVTAKAEVFGDDYDIYVFDEEVTDLLKFQALGNAAAELYICHLHDQMLHWDIKFGFFIPSLMTPTIEINERLATLVGRLNMPDKDQLFCYFLPYVDHIEWHWMLCVIFPRQHKVLWLDSSTEEKDIRADAKELVDTGLDRYYQGCVPRSTRKVEWKKVLCPRQPPSFYCGYYVLSYIQDIIAFVRANNGVEVEDINQSCFPNGVEPYAHDKILGVRDEIASYLREYVTTHPTLL